MKCKNSSVCDSGIRDKFRSTGTPRGKATNSLNCSGGHCTLSFSVVHSKLGTKYYLQFIQGSFNNS